MDTGVFFVALALSNVLLANGAVDWPLIQTMFLRYYCRENDSHIDISLKNSGAIVPLLDKNQTTVIVIPGYLQDVDTDSIKSVTRALLSFTSTNVFSLDYRKMALIYPLSVAHVPHIGAALAAAIDNMAEAGLDPTAFHLIGLSLGGQICAYTGRRTAKKVARITGLDPAGPLFFSGYLTKNDALFVCIIHTDMDGYGIGRKTEHAGFKPNLGRRIQNGCNGELLENPLPAGICSHLRSLTYFEESIRNPFAFPSIKCDTDFDFMSGTCDASSVIPMGYHTPNNASGEYYCQTNSEHPYSLGTAGIAYNYRI